MYHFFDAPCIWVYCYSGGTSEEGVREERKVEHKTDIFTPTLLCLPRDSSSWIEGILTYPAHTLWCSNFQRSIFSAKHVFLTYKPHQNPKLWSPMTKNIFQGVPMSRGAHILPSLPGETRAKLLSWVQVTALNACKWQTVGIQISFKLKQLKCLSQGKPCRIEYQKPCFGIPPCKRASWLEELEDSSSPLVTIQQHEFIWK